MLKEVLASNAAKLVAACVCPVVGASVVALKVPQVRAAVHRATAPKAQPHREARAKPRVRDSQQVMLAMNGPLQAGMLCQQPISFQDAPLQPMTAPVSTPVFVDLPRTERIYVPSTCASVGGGTGVITRLASVPEPATWAQMLAGFALMGGTVRAGRRRRTLAA